MMRLGILVGALAAAGLVLAVELPAQQPGTPPDVKVTIDHNAVTSATPAFKFARMPPPMKDDAGAKAVLKLVDGEGDSNGAALNALVDGLWPRDEDEPGANFFFDAGTAGGRFRMDLGSAIDISEVRSYSWHPNTRGPQVYTLYASDGADPKFNLSPRNDVNPATAGWTLIAMVDTRTPQGDPGGQYGVSIKKAGGSLGKFRHLLFVCSATETDDDWGNTFYSEIDVIAANTPNPEGSRGAAEARRDEGGGFQEEPRPLRSQAECLPRIPRSSPRLRVSA
jgi:hypothetical protein